MLHDFIATHRAVLVDRCRVMVAARSKPKSAAKESANGIPVFLDQLIAALAREQNPPRRPSDSKEQRESRASTGALDETASSHGRDLFEHGFTLEQVVRDYGDVCQAVTNLAFETGTSIAVDEFRTFNRCLDNAIAHAATEYALHSAPTLFSNAAVPDARLGPFAHELRNYLHTATLVIAAIKSGNLGISGATGAVLDRSLLGMRGLIDRALAEARVTACISPRRETIKIIELFDKLSLAFSFEAAARGSALTVTLPDDNTFVSADPDMLIEALSNLLQNAFKFGKHPADVQLRGIVRENRVLIEVEDRCGGLPAGNVATMFLPFIQNDDDRSGLGLGLAISKRSIEANGGVLTVRDLPGSGCVFTVDLPRIEKL
jgi:signal transduction histidine kinase